MTTPATITSDETRLLGQIVAYHEMSPEDREALEHDARMATGGNLGYLQALIEEAADLLRGRSAS